ncbi:MAG: TonB-dependent receptor domain-containing protein [Adhaeribacter sp.]
MKKLLSLAMATMLAAPLLAQAPQPSSAASRPADPAPAPARGTGRISGFVLDEASKNPVEFATVALLSQASGKAVDGAITDGKGRFTLTRVPQGTYQLNISFLGYAPSSVPVVISGGKNEIDLGVLRLKADAKTLKEVAVTGEKPLVEDKVDRLVYNAEKDISNTGGTAADVLKKVPGLTVDLEGNLQLRGSGNIRVLINNKPSSIMAASIADAIKQIPSDQIKSVEVITSPSARYDAEGTAGIINIVLKKNGLQGLNGNATASYGTRNSNVGGNVNFRKNKFGINTSAGHNWNNNPGRNTAETFYQGHPRLDRLSQQMTGRREGSFDFLQLGVDYDLHKKNSLAAGLRYQTGDFTFTTTQHSTQYLHQGPAQSTTRANKSAFQMHNYDLNLDYTRTFDKPGQELTFLGLLSRNKRDNFLSAQLYDGDQGLQSRERNNNEAFNEEITLQTDYTQPLGKNRLLELGAKAILRQAESDFAFYLANPAAGPFVSIPERSDAFNYDQDVASVYASYGFSLPKQYSVKVGSRLEHTAIDGNFLSSDTTVQQDYNNLIPSIALSKKLSKTQTLKLNYTRRIQRPQLFFLNPFVNNMDTFNIQTGNPQLRAELTDAYELGYSTYFKSGTSLNATLYWRQTNNSIQSYTLPMENGVNKTTFGNIGRQANYGMSLSGNAKFLAKGNVSGNVNLYYMDLESQDLRASNANLMYNANLNVSYTFDKGFSAQAFGMFNSPRVTLQGQSSSWSYYNMAVKKEILKKKGSLSAGIDNPFSQTIKLRNTFKTTPSEQHPVTSRQENTLYVYTRQVRVSLQYQFGKTDFKNTPRRKKRISNDDAKQGGDGNPGQ